MNEQGQVPRPFRIELGVRNRTDEHVVALLEHYTTMKVDVVNTNVSNEVHGEMIDVEFYSEEGDLIDKIQFPYWDDLSEEQQKQLMEQENEYKDI